MRLIDADKFAEDICKLSAIDEYSANAVIFLLHEQTTVDIAREIFAELETLMLDGKIGNVYSAKVINPDKYTELKNKYIGGVGE